MNLLKYDTRHIRAFQYQKPFIQFSHLQDNLLPLANILFASSASLKINNSQLQQCIHLISLLEKPSYTITITYKNNILEIFYQTPCGFNSTHSFSSENLELWHKEFTNAIKEFSLAQLYNTKYSGKTIMEQFFKELSIELPSSMQILTVNYTNEFFFIPFEFLYRYYYITINLPSEGSNSKEIELIKNIAIMYDPDLELAQEESLYMFKLLEKRGFVFNNQQPDVALISAHGQIVNHKSMLQNTTLQELTHEINPQLIIFNTCLIGQQNSGIIQEFINKKTITIASPFFTLCSKTIFSPLLRFLTNTSTQSITIAFWILKIFYPNIYQYFRIYIPTDKQ